MSQREPESPGLPENTGSLSNRFAPGAFSTRSLPPYPPRAHYAAFDPANQHPPPSMPPVDGRIHSNPPALETAPFTLRERVPYPSRNMDEITDWAHPAVVEPRYGVSEPTTQREREAAGAFNLPNDWHAWRDENRPRRTAWMGHDNSRFALYGGREVPTETAAVADGDVVMESIELESDPLVALRNSTNQSQRIIRRQVDRAVESDDRIRDLSSRLRTATQRNTALVRVNQDTARDLAVAQRERDEARNEMQYLRSRLDEPEEEYHRWQAQQEAFAQANHAEAHMLEMNRSLRQSEAELTTRLQAALGGQATLQMQLDQMDNDREGLELQRNHYESERDRQRDRNGRLEARVQELEAQLAAARTGVNQAPAMATVNQAPAIAAPVNPPPTVVEAREPAVAGSRGGSTRGDNQRGRGGRGQIGGNRGGSTRGNNQRGRGGRGRRGKAEVTRKQPGRSCKVEKNYRV